MLEDSKTILYLHEKFAGKEIGGTLTRRSELLLTPPDPKSLVKRSASRTSAAQAAARGAR